MELENSSDENDNSGSTYSLRELTVECEDINLVTKHLDESINDVVCQVTKKRRVSYRDQNAEVICSKSSEILEKNRRSIEKFKKNEEKMKKDLEREAEKKRKEEERKRKEDEKRIKDAEREEEKRRKEEEKRIKEAEREEERKRKEEDKKIKEIEKEEERKRKEEEKKLKDAEKEEERRKKEEEKKRKDKEEEDKNRLVKKQQAIMSSFLKKDKTEIEEVQTDSKQSYDIKAIGIFRPFEIKKNMQIANCRRSEKLILSGLEFLPPTNVDYFQTVQTLAPLQLKPTKEEETFAKTDVNDVITKLEGLMRVKVLHFAENVRPTFCGTWRKKSSCITGLDPLAEDKECFDYEVDSDADWVYESGEDIMGSDDEEEEEINPDQTDTEFLVPHGYLSAGEDCSDVDEDEASGDGAGTATAVVAVEIEDDSSHIPESPGKRQMLIELREKQFQAEVRQSVQNVNPNVVGPFFRDKAECAKLRPLLESFNMVCVWSEGLPISCHLQNDAEYSSATGLPKHKVRKAVPPEAMPHLIRLLHHNAMCRPKLAYEFRMFWEKQLTGKLPEVSFEEDLQGKDWDEFSIGKKRLTTRITEIADKKDGKYIVKPEVIQEYQISTVEDEPANPVSDGWQYVSNINNLDVSVAKLQKMFKIK